MPNGIAQIAMSPMTPSRPPRAWKRRSPIMMATIAPMMIPRAYARIGIGPMSQTPCDGLGMYDATLTGLVPLDAGAQVLGQPADGLEPGGLVLGIQQTAYEGGPHDPRVG